MENNQDSEESQLIQVQNIKKSMQKHQVKRFKPESTNLANDFIGFEDQQEYLKINERFNNLKRFIENLDNPSTNIGGDITILNNIEKNNNLNSINKPQDLNPNGDVCSPVKKIRCKSINDLLEKSDDKNDDLSDSHSAPKLSQNKESQLISKLCHNKSLPQKDKTSTIKSGKSVPTSTDDVNIPITIAISKGDISNASFTASNQKIAYTYSKPNQSSMGTKLFSSDSQGPTLPVSSSVYNNHSMSTIYPSPYMFNAMPSDSNYMQQGMNTSIGMSSFPVPSPQRFQQPSSFVFNILRNKYSYMRNKQSTVSSNNPRYLYERAQNRTCSLLPSAPTEVAFVCTYCSFTFVNKELFNEHLHAGLCSGLTGKGGTNGDASKSNNYQDKEKEYDSNQVAYACHICEKSFDEKDELNSHKVDQHNFLFSNIHSKTFSCTLCYMQFILSKDLFKHLKDCHNITNLKDWIPENSFYLQSKNDDNNHSYASNMPQIDNLSQSILKSKRFLPENNEKGTPTLTDDDCVIVESNMKNPQIATCLSSEAPIVEANCSSYIPNDSVKPKESTPKSTSLSTVSTSANTITADSSPRKMSKRDSAITASSTSSAASSHSNFSITSNANEYASHEIKLRIGKNKVIYTVASPESNTGKSINCPGCSFTFTGDDLFAQHLKAGLCSKFLTDTISKKFPGYTVCNIKKKEQKYVEDQNASSKKSNNKCHKVYMCEICMSKFATKEILLTHKKVVHKITIRHPVQTVLTENHIQNQNNYGVTNSNLLNQANHSNTQVSTSTSEVLTASQSEILQNVNSIISKQLSIVKGITGSDDNNNTTPTFSPVEANNGDNENCVSNPISSEESSEDMSKNYENFKSHELELEVKKMELSAWKSWKEACDLQAQFWRKKLSMPEENKSNGNSSEV